MIRSVSCIRTRLSAGLPGRALETAHRLASTFTATDIEFTKTSNPSSMPPKEELTFGTTFSDHMLEIDWSAEGGWEKPKISAYSTLAISPAASGLHYGLQCFEGMKAYRAKSDPSKISLFRPDCNMQRMNDSMARLQMPSFDGDALIDCMRELIRIDEKWVPEGDGYSLYIRPTAVATHPWLGVGDAQQIKLFVITCPVGPYYPTGFNPVKLYADNVNVRAWPGGVGNCKVGGNYATTIKPAKEAMAKGYHQVLWMFGEDDSVTECGAMNLFFFWVNKDTGRKELVTAPLDRGDILPGVTRRSLLELARRWGEFDVSERFVTMPEVRDAANEGRLLEAFGAGTAAVVAPIETIHYDGEDINIEATGPLCMRLWREINDVYYGEKQVAGWTVDV